MYAWNFYDETKPLYKETDVSGAGLVAAFLQTKKQYKLS